MYTKVQQLVVQILEKWRRRWPSLLHGLKERERERERERGREREREREREKRTGPRKGKRGKEAHSSLLDVRITAEGGEGGGGRKEGRKDWWCSQDCQVIYGITTKAQPYTKSISTANKPNFKCSHNPLTTFAIIYSQKKKKKGRGAANLATLGALPPPPSPPPPHD